MSICKARVVIIGGGPACLKAAYDLAPICDVIIYEKEKNIGQKFLVAGKGGFNLSNAVYQKELLNKYSPSGFLDDALKYFKANDTRDWMNSLGILTFVGSGNKILAKKDIKPAQVLQSIKNYLLKHEVKIFTNSKFIGFNNNNIMIETDGVPNEISSDYFIFGLGGASWSKTGSDGKWLDEFNSIGINTLPFQPSNCGVNIKWNESFITAHAGKPLKNIKVSCDEYEILGEMTITDYGLEGNALYPIIPAIRNKINQNKTPQITIDFKPDNNLEQLHEKVFKTTTAKDYAKVLNLNRTQMALLKAYTTKNEYLNHELLVKKIKTFYISIDSLRPVDEAISTIGGIDIEELNKDFSLKKRPNIFTIGEMVNWDAPTGGFLLQACFSMAHTAALSIIEREKIEG